MTLYLLPNQLAENADPSLYLPPGLQAIVDRLDGLIAESPKEGRAFLKRYSQRKIADVPLALLNEHTTDQELDALLLPLQQGKTWGIVSDAGLPCMADPGARLVERARRAGMNIRALAGPCSFVLALMLSGLSAQKFAFHGYLPREPRELAAMLKLLDQRIRKEGETQVFIEAPYRNMRLLQSLLSLPNDLILSVACDLTAPTEEVITLPIKDWKARPLPAFDGRPAIFALGNA